MSRFVFINAKAMAIRSCFFFLSIKYRAIVTFKFLELKALCEFHTNYHVPGGSTEPTISL